MGERGCLETGLDVPSSLLLFLKHWPSLAAFPFLWVVPLLFPCSAARSLGARLSPASPSHVNDTTKVRRMDTILDCFTTSSVLMVTSWLCASKSFERQREHYILTGSSQEANEATSEEASSRVPGYNKSNCSYSHILSTYLFIECLLYVRHSFSPVDASASKTVKDVCCPRANILVEKLDNEQIKKSCQMVIR